MALQVQRVAHLSPRSDDAGNLSNFPERSKASCLLRLTASPPGPSQPSDGLGGGGGVLAVLLILLILRDRDRS